MEKHCSILSNISKDAILSTKQKGEQTMIFINRRGYSRTLKCKDCGYEEKCENCNNLLSFHKKTNELKCHYCGYTKHNINSCSNCGSKTLEPYKGAGVEQIQNEIIDFAKEKNIDLKTMIFSSDEIKKEDDIEKIINEINNSNVDIIIGTQIMTKGYHFPLLTTIIVLDIDSVCLDGDFRAYEKMFQMLFQLSGRAGRERDGAKVYIQTENTNNIILKNIKNYDIKTFYSQELSQRKKYNLPPFIRFIAIIVSSEDNNLARQIADKIKVLLDINLSKIKGVSVLGPTESQISYMKKKYRYRFLIKTPKNNKTIEILNKIKDDFDISKKVQVKIDVDPYSFI